MTTKWLLRSNKEHRSNVHSTNNNSNHNPRHTHYYHQGNYHENKKWCRPRMGVIKANCDANLTIDGFWGLAPSIMILEVKS
ncbi:hypothetical protein QL285_055840 [Trifolium repens]|nr:hypothetical protein QL285_055840 [Trifolium repens]